MKKLFFGIITLLSLSASAQVGIGVSTANMNASAQLEVVSTTKGFLAPRMNESQKNAISNPATGLLIYQTDATSGFYYFDGSVWKSGLGPQGIQGATGPQGIAGTNGLDGATGPMGPQGEPGMMGMQGMPGMPGEQGPMGPMGPQGEPGMMGMQGMPGIQGMPGMPGEQGPMGPMGPQGEPGMIGMPGEQGPMGPMGPQGERGLMGMQGMPGMPGEQGPMGPMGPQGENGPVGPQGPAGTTPDLSAYATVIDLNTLQYQVEIIQSETQFALNTKEKAINKSSDVNLGDSDILFPTQNATKTYVDTKFAAISTGGGASVNEAADEFTAYANQEYFNLSHTPAAASKVKMYINGIRISNTAYSVNGISLIYNFNNNGNYIISASDRIQFDYSY